jgi:hypothetical protein
MRGRDMKNVFPCILMSLDFLSSLVYLIMGDYRRALYWLAAGILTLTVTI